ncbi:MBL fold metallo-hydrolase [Salarchaeum japonicum]|uniref:Metallo-beta-lactamase domain-containing protein n=1 Tax=Salarchaeum japonicum TaxID=555573 RepID=A0AAV3T4R4_9EURY|nr:MBL fold metallo-hydrolase [Salarchaeum japonicum]
MVTELADGVYDLELPLETDDGTRVFHAVAIEADHGVVLVDAGLPNQAADVRAALDDIGHAVADVSLLVFTHQDGDHVGAAADLLLAGDALIGGEDGVEGPNERVTPDLERAYESVTHLAEYEYDRVLCYHGGLVDATEEDVAALDPYSPGV